MINAVSQFLQKCWNIRIKFLSWAYMFTTHHFKFFLGKRVIQTDRETDRETETETETERDRLRQAGRQRQTDRQTDRQTEKEKGTETGRQTDRDRQTENKRGRECVESTPRPQSVGVGNTQHMHASADSHWHRNHYQSCDMHRPALRALVYDILPSTTAVFSYATGSRKLSANEQFFCWCSNRKLQRKDVVNQCLEFGIGPDGHGIEQWPGSLENMVWTIYIYITEGNISRVLMYSGNPQKQKFNGKMITGH